MGRSTSPDSKFCTNDGSDQPGGTYKIQKPQNSRDSLMPRRRPIGREARRRYHTDRVLLHSLAILGAMVTFACTTPVADPSSPYGFDMTTDHEWCATHHASDMVPAMACPAVTSVVCPAPTRVAVSPTPTPHSTDTHRSKDPVPPSSSNAERITNGKRHQSCAESTSANGQNPQRSAKRGVSTRCPGRGGWMQDNPPTRSSS